MPQKPHLLLALLLSATLLPRPARAQDPSPLLPHKIWLAGHNFYAANTDADTATATTADATPPIDHSTHADAETTLPTLRYRVLVQAGLEAEATSFLQTVHEVLANPQGWAAAGLSFQHVLEDYDFTILLARGKAVAKLCKPLDTGLYLSCAMYGRAHLNLSRWRLGAQSWSGDLDGYRRYLIQHEVGHLLGMPHQKCPGKGKPAPLMMQQTKRISPCARNHDPTPAELLLLQRIRAAHAR